MGASIDCACKLCGGADLQYYIIDRLRTQGNVGMQGEPCGRAQATFEEHHSQGWTKPRILKCSGG